MRERSYPKGLLKALTGSDKGTELDAARTATKALLKASGALGLLPFRFRLLPFYIRFRFSSIRFRSAYVLLCLFAPLVSLVFPLLSFACPFMPSHFRLLSFHLRFSLFHFHSLCRLTSVCFHFTSSSN
jgi:hypothetical protein